MFNDCVSRAQSCLTVRTKRSLTIKLNSGHCWLSMGKVLSLKINVPLLISCTKQKKKKLLTVFSWTVCLCVPLNLSSIPLLFVCVFVNSLLLSQSEPSARVCCALVTAGPSRVLPVALCNPSGRINILRLSFS